MNIRVSHLHFSYFHNITGRDECLISTFVSYKHRVVAVGKGYSSEIDFEVIKVI